MSKRFCLNKYSGTGNDFIVIDDRNESFPVHDAAFIRQICDADGVILLQHRGADFQMRIFNKDGSEAESCGNGLRCLARYLLDQGILSNNRIWMHDRWIHFFYENGRVGVDMGTPSDLRLNLATERGVIHFVNTGVPHAVQFVTDPAQIDLQSFGPWLRHHPLFQPKGTNASVAALRSDGSILVRTYERGVEGETLACGTGACAVAVIASALFGCKERIHILYPGGELEVNLSSSLVLLGAAEAMVDWGCTHFAKD